MIHRLFIDSFHSYFWRSVYFWLNYT